MLLKLVLPVQIQNGQHPISLLLETMFVKKPYKLIFQCLVVGEKPYKVTTGTTGIMVL